MAFLQTDGAGETNYERVFSSRPEVLTAWQQLLGAIRANMEPRRYELATVAAARRMRSSYSMLAHGKILAEEHLDPADRDGLITAWTG
jgi:hypothetical protein